MALHQIKICVVLNYLIEILSYYLTTKGSYGHPNFNLTCPSIFEQRRDNCFGDNISWFDDLIGGYREISTTHKPYLILIITNLIAPKEIISI